MIAVELGAGARPTSGYLAVDIQADLRPDVVANLLDLPFATASIDVLRCVDCAEHVPQALTAELFAEWARVVRPGGTIFVQVPDMPTIFRWFVEEPYKLTTPPGLPDTPLAGACWRIYGGGADGKYVDRMGDPRWNSHYAGFSGESLTEQLEVAGFDLVRGLRNAHPNILWDGVRR